MLRPAVPCDVQHRKPAERGLLLSLLSLLIAFSLHANKRGTASLAYAGKNVLSARPVLGRGRGGWAENGCCGVAGVFCCCFGVCCDWMTAGRGAIEVHWMLRPAPALFRIANVLSMVCFLSQFA